MRAIDGMWHCPLGWTLGAHGDATTRKLEVDTGPCLFVSDEWYRFLRLLPEKAHFYGKDLAFPIEASKSDIRCGLARFLGKTKGPSRNLQILNLSLALFHHLRDSQVLENLIRPFLSFFR